MPGLLHADALKRGTALALILTVGATSAWSQQTDRNSFPPGPDFAGVAGSPEENARITELCGPNRNASDGYFAAPAFAQQTHAPIVTSDQPFSVEILATLDRSIGMTFLPSGNILLSQRAGGMRTVTPDGTVSEPLAGVPEVASGRLAASSDILLDRDFASNRTLYYGFIAPGGVGRIISARLSDDEGALQDIKVLLEDDTMTPRRIVQIADGTLLIASAEVASGGPNPQSMQSLLGKVLRISTDGSIPADNPFVGDPGAKPSIYALGFRDIQAMGVHPETGQAWAVENTPMGGDELNPLVPGGNYGFPVISYGRENNGAMINDGKTAQAGMEQPLYWWTPSIAPSGVAFYTGDALADWKGDVFVGGMSSEQLVRLELEDGKVVAEEKLLMDRCKRIKDVRQGLDGLLYVLTDETPSELLRIRPGGDRSDVGGAVIQTAAFTATPEELALGQSAYALSCAACHGAGGEGRVGPPIRGRDDLAAIIMVINDGVGEMPPIGSRLAPGEAAAIAKHVISAFGGPAT